MYLQIFAFCSDIHNNLKCSSILVCFKNLLVPLSNKDKNAVSTVFYNDLIGLFATSSFQDDS